MTTGAHRQEVCWFGAQRGTVTHMRGCEDDAPLRPDGRLPIPLDAPTRAGMGRMEPAVPHSSRTFALSLGALDTDKLTDLAPLWAEIGKLTYVQRP